MYLAVLFFLFHTEVLIRYRKCALSIKKTQALKNHLHHETKLIIMLSLTNGQTSIE